jgi:hypothetical protein
VKKLLILFIVFFSWSAQAQTYTYKPLNLDTSSFWIQEFHVYYGFPQLNLKGEVLQYVEKDTLINNKTYSKIRGYCTVPYRDSFSFHPWFSLSELNCYNPTIFIREDTVAMKVYRLESMVTFNEVVLLDFDLQVGDSISHIPPDSLGYGFPVDSISMVNIEGVNRRVYFTNPIGIYERIEGIGANMNFPDVGASEWGTPRFSLKTFVKNNTVLIRRVGYPIDSCYKKSRALNCWPLAMSELHAAEIGYYFSNNMLYISNYITPIKFEVFNPSGQSVFKDNVKVGFYEHDFYNLPKGIYIIHIQSEEKQLIEKILVH